MGSWTGTASRWRSGDAASQFDLQELMRPFLLEMLRHVRRGRPDGLRARIDSEGVVQEAFKSFLSGIPQGEFPDLPDREAMKRTLTHLVNRALADEIRRHTRRKNNPARETGPGPLVAVSVSTLPIPDLGDWLDELTCAMRDVHENAMDMVDLLLQGYSTAECARELGLGLRTTQKIRKRMREIWHDDGIRNEPAGNAGGD